MSHHHSVDKGFADEMAKLSRRIAKLIPLKRPMVAPKAATSAASREPKKAALGSNIALGAGLLGTAAYGASRVLDKPIRREQWREKVRTGPLGQRNMMQAPRSFG